MTVKPQETLQTGVPANEVPGAFEKIRALILEVANETGTAPLTETVKWGEPAFVPAKRDGTTIRLTKTETQAKLLVHCQTSLVETYRSRLYKKLGIKTRAELVQLAIEMRVLEV